MKNITFEGDSPYQGIYFDGLDWTGQRLAFGADSTGTIIQSVDNDAGDGIHFKAVGGGTDLMVINNTGSVGIGTNSPAGTLHLWGTGTNGANAVLYFGDRGSAANPYIKEYGSGDSDQLEISARLGLFIPSGNVSIGSSAYNAGSDVQIYGSNPSIALERGSSSSSVDWKLENTAGDFGIYEGYSSTSSGAWESMPRLFILSGGSVGIGTASPSSLLELYGSGVAGNLTLSNSDTTLLAGDIIGEIGFKSYDTSTSGTKVKAYIRGVAESEFTGGDHRSKIEFGTATGTGDPTTRMTITGEGNVNLSANVNLTMNGGNKISSNVTCIKIQGPTSVLEVC